MTEPERLADWEELARGARRGAIARFASSISHALGTPLNVIAGRAAMIGMSERPDPNDARENARIIENQVRNITELLQRALKFARDGAPQPASTDVRAVAGRAVALLEPLAESRGAQVELSPGEPLEALVVASRLLDTIAVLVSWGTARVPSGETVSVSVRRADSVQPPTGERGRARGGPTALVEVRCPGATISPILLEHVYEPWLADATEDRDTAITLAFAFGIAREHRGFIQAQHDERSTTFTVCWPI